MSEPWNEGQIARYVAAVVLQKKCLLMVNNCNWTGHECDVLAVAPNLKIIDVEIKVSRADLKADAGKDKWWHRTYTPYSAGLPQERVKTLRQHPPRVWKHYYVLPAEIWDDSLLAALPNESSGVITVDRSRLRRGELVHAVVRRTKANTGAAKLSAEQVLSIARLANLRMWDAYEGMRVLREQMAEQQEAA